MPGKAKANKYSLGTKKKGIDLTVPSGSTCLVRRPGVQGLIAAGALDSLDSLSEVGRAAAGNGGIPKKDDILAALDVADRVVEYCVLQPVVKRPIWINASGVEVPLPDEDRDPDITYTDEIELEDRMFIVQFVVGGSADIKAFREGLGTGMGDLAAM